MKQIFTLLTALTLTSAFCTKANAQNINEGFNTSAEVVNLVNSCWNFNSVNFSSSSPISGTGSVVSQLGVAGEIITPELVMSSPFTVSFNYATVGTSSGAKKVQILIVDGATATKVLEDPISGSGTFSFTMLSTDPHGNLLTGNKKIIIRLTDNISLKMDNLSINAPYTYATGCPFAGIPLPVTLLSFQGALAKDQAQLNWSVADNETGNYFEVERSTDGKSFSTVAVVSTTQKQGNEAYSYKETAQATAYYRLRIVNKDRSASYSKIILVKTQADNQSALRLLQNPVQQNLTFSITSSTSANNELAVYNLVGVKVYAQKLMLQKGTNSISVKLNSYLTAGTYILEVKNNSERSTTKFIKQ